MIIQFWLQWVAAFLVVVAVLTAGILAHEIWLWRKERDDEP